MPYPSLGPLFTGRLDVLAKIHDAVRRAGDVPITAHVVEGMGGIGKTRAAVEYAWAYQDLYTAVLFLNAETPDRLDTELALQAAPLGLASVADAEDPIKRNAVLDWLRRHPGWLLILDNVDTEAAALAVGGLLRQLHGGHVILTSRRHGFSPGAESIVLGTLQPSDAAAFLLARTADTRRVTLTDSEDALALATALDGVPLALELASATIRDRKCSLADYRSDWDADRAAVTGWNSPKITTYHTPVDATLRGATADVSEAARLLLEHLAFMAPDPVPLTVLDDSGQRALLDLVQHGLATQDATGECFSVDRLVQDATRRSMEPPTAQARLVETLAWIDSAFVGDPEDAETWPVLIPLAPHVEVLVWAADRIGILAPTRRLMAALGTLFNTQALYTQAEPLLRRVLAIEEASFGAEHPNVARHLNNMATLLQTTNRSAEAESLMRRALAIDKASLGSEHPNVATDLNNLAALLQATNRLGEAEPLMRQALAIEKARFGGDHPRVAVHLNNLATLLQATNQVREAERLMRRALVIDAASYGDEHPNVARDLNNLATIMQDTNRLEEAESLIRRARAIDAANYGAGHPRIAIHLNNLAQVMQDMNRLGEAEPLMRQALAINEANYGVEHPRVATDLNNLATLLQATHRLREAEALMRRALAIDEASYGVDHPRVASHLNNLAVLLQDTNRVREAEPLMRRALAIDEASYGADHPDVARDLNNLGRLLQATNRLEEAEPLTRRATVIVLKFQRATGHPHPHRETALANHAHLLRELGRDEASIAAEQQAMHREAGLA